MGSERANADPCMLRDTSASRHLGLVLTVLLLRTTGLPACSLPHKSNLTSLGSRSSYVALSAQPTERFSGSKRY
jgi:hypothetical protein